MVPYRRGYRPRRRNSWHRPCCDTYRGGNPEVFACASIVSVLRAPERSWGFEERVEAAVEILTEHFENDESLWEEIEGILRESGNVPYGAFVSLARARPQSVLLRERAEQVLRTPS